MISRLKGWVASFQLLLEGYIIPDASIRWFRRCVYVLLLLNMVLMYPELDVFYNHALAKQHSFFIVSKLLFLPVFKHCYYYIWGLACAAVAFAIYKESNRLLSLAIFIITLNYLSLMDAAANVAATLLALFVFSLLFIHEGAVVGSRRQLINNAAVLLLQVHMCALYLLNGFGKMAVAGWRDGSYMQLILQLPYYTDLRFVPHWFLNPVVCFITAWAVMVFEIAFALLIWFKPLRKSLIIAGLVFHIGIALLLSLPDFGLVMMAGYLPFADFKKKPSKVGFSKIS